MEREDGAGISLSAGLGRGPLREKAWHELVCRLAGVMRLLASAKSAGREDIP